MSVIIQIYSNHNLLIDNYDGGIKLIERALDIDIKEVNKVNKELTDDESKLEYFTNHDFFSKKFLDFREIFLMSNFRLCERINIYRHFVEFHISGNINIKTFHWRNLISKVGYFETMEFMKEFDGTLKEWDNTRNYINKIAKQLGGTATMYLNDGAKCGVVARDLLLDGENYTSFLKKISDISIPTEYKDLVNNIKAFDDNDWFIERI